MTVLEFAGMAKEAGGKPFKQVSIPIDLRLASSLWSTTYLAWIWTRYGYRNCKASFGSKSGRHRELQITL